MSLSLKLLGAFSLRHGSGVEISLPTRKTRALLAYLAINAGRPQPRERLMALLWSDRGERQARQSLNQALQAIRKLGEDGKPLLDSDGERVTLNGAAVDCDVQRLQALVKDQPAEASALYGGPFLDGLSIPDPAFEEWLLSTRSELRALACDALEAAANMSDDAETALICARQLVTLDPLREEAHRRLMQLLHRSGDRTGALRQYQSCVDILKRELEVEPDPATRALFEEIRRDLGAIATEKSSTLESETQPSQPDKPSIAVLPFDNLSGDASADHFADGLMEDLIMALAKVRELVVIARHSTAVYRGTAVPVQQIAEALRVRYVLEGSVRIAGSMLRCTVHLIDTKLGHDIWSERYDRPLGDVFKLQDDIVRHILIELQVRFTEGEGARIASRGTRNLEAWLLRAQAAEELGRVRREGVIRARELFEAACRADPDWARPIAGIAACHYYQARNGWSQSREDSIAMGIELSERSIATDPNDPFGYVILRNLNVLLGNHERALSASEKALSIAPNDQLAVRNHAAQLLWMGNAERAVQFFERGARLSPNMMKTGHLRHGLALHLAGRLDQAIAVLEDLVQREPDWPPGLAELAAAYAGAGLIEKGHAITKRMLELDRRYTVSRHLYTTFFQHEQNSAWLRALLLKAGLPE